MAKSWEWEKIQNTFVVYYRWKRQPLNQQSLCNSCWMHTSIAHCCPVQHCIVPYCALHSIVRCGAVSKAVWSWMLHLLLSSFLALDIFLSLIKIPLFHPWSQFWPLLRHPVSHPSFPGFRRPYFCTPFSGAQESCVPGPWYFALFTSFLSPDSFCSRPVSYCLWVFLCFYSSIS